MGQRHQYRTFPGAVPREYIVATIVPDGAELSTGGALAEGAEWTVFMPVETLPVEEALTLGRAASELHRIPFFIRMEPEVEWDDAWGDLVE